MLSIVDYFIPDTALLKNSNFWPSMKNAKGRTDPPSCRDTYLPLKITTYGLTNLRTLLGTRKWQKYPKYVRTHLLFPWKTSSIILIWSSTSWLKWRFVPRDERFFIVDFIRLGNNFSFFNLGSILWTWKFAILKRGGNIHCNIYIKFWQVNWAVWQGLIKWYFVSRIVLT